MKEEKTSVGSLMVERSLFQVGDGGSIPTSAHHDKQVKWKLPFYVGMFAEEFLKEICGLRSPKQLRIKKVPHGLANNFVKKHHYLRRKIYIAKNVSYGIFYGKWLVGVCMYGLPVWTTYPGIVPPYKTMEVPELLRLSLLECCPPNSASRIIALTTKMLKQDWFIEPKIIFTMADLSLGFTGSIYRASGFEFYKNTVGRPANIGRAHGKWGKNKDTTIAEKAVFVYKYPATQ